MSIGVLGPLTVDGDDAGLGPRDRVVLAALTVARGQVLTAEQLADALWGDDPPVSWAKVVQGCVVRLRKVLGWRAIETSPQGYRLAVAADDIDALRFERLVGRARELLTLGEPERASYLIDQALGLWRGRPLTEVEGWDRALAEAGRLDEQRLDAEELRVEAALRTGRHQEVLAEARALVEQAPVRERRWALLALAQYQAGRQSEALRTLHQVRTVLSRELALDPGPDLVDLEQAILRQDPSLVAATALPEPSATCPYQGLAPYDVSDADGFFGRDGEVTACLQRLAASGVLAVVGPSGGGKSSLVRAGVAAARERAGRRIAVITPGARPMDALTALPGSGPAPVLVVDQFEEAFSLCEEPAERERFCTALVAHAERGELVVALRADRLGDVSPHREFARLIESGLYLLGAMRADDLRAAIEGPARQAALPLEPGLVDLLVREVEGEPGALPLLSHALRETWRLREGRTLTVAGYQATGGIRGAVAQSAEQVFAQVSPGEQPLLRDLLLRLVAPTGEGEPMRSRLPRRLLAGDEQQERLIELLVGARLITSDDGVVELAHESLARAWPRLRGWLEDDTDGQRILHHLTVAADAWEAMRRPDSELYGGIRLAKALEWRDRAGPRLTPTERAFLDASRARADEDLRALTERAERETATARRTRRLASGLAGVLVLALVAAGLAVRYQRDATARADDARAASTTADANRIAALSRSVGSLDLSLLLAAEAVHIADTPATRDGLLEALVEHRRATQVVPLGGQAFDAELSADDETMFGSLFSSVIAWRTGSTAPPREVNQWFRPEDIAASPTRDLMALWSWKGDTPRVGVFSADGTKELELVGNEIGGDPTTFGFSPDGGRLLMLVVNQDAQGSGGPASQISLREVDVDTGRLIRDRIVHRGPDMGTWVTGTIAEDASTAVAWNWDQRGTATYFDLGDGTRTPLQVERRASDYEGYIPLSVGAVKRWSDGALTVYDEQGRQVQVLEVHPAPVMDVVVSPDRTWAATGDKRGSIILWDIHPKTGVWSQRESLSGHDGAVSGLALDRAGTTLASVSYDGTAISWDVSKEAGFGSLAAGGPVDRRWISSSPQTVVDGRLAVAPTRPGGSDAGSVQALFWDPVNGRVVDRVDVGESVAGTAFGSSVSVSPDRSMVAVTHARGAVVLDARTREELTRIVLPPTESSRADGTRQPEFVWSAGWTADGSRLLLGAEGETFEGTAGGDIVVVDTDTWQVQPERVDIGGTVQVMQLSPDRRWLAAGLSISGIDNAPPPVVELLDPDTLEVRRVLRLDDGDQVFDLSFSPDARLLAAGGQNGTLTVFDTESGKRLRSPAKVHNNYIQQVEWMPDGRTVVTTGFDGMAAMYDVERGLVRGRLPGSSDLAEASTYLLSFTEQRITTLVGGREARTYPLGVDRWLDYACQVAGRDLTRDEWASYLPNQPYHRTCTA